MPNSTAANKVRTTRQRTARARQPLAAGVGTDPLTGARLKFAFVELERAGVLVGARSQKLSTRVDPGLIEAARKRTGLRSDSDLINAALAVIAAGDDFGVWLVSQAGRLPEDFELAL